MLPAPLCVFTYINRQGQVHVEPDEWGCCYHCDGLSTICAHDSVDLVGVSLLQHAARAYEHALFELVGIFFLHCAVRRGFVRQSPDFLFEAIKTEREGTPRHYLEAVEALSLSSVEFFHSRNFSMKFTAPILLAAARGEGTDKKELGGGGIRHFWEADNEDAEDCGNDEYDEVCRRIFLAALMKPGDTARGNFPVDHTSYSGE